MSGSPSRKRESNRRKTKILSFVGAKKLPGKHRPLVLFPQSMDWKPLGPGSGSYLSVKQEAAFARRPPVLLYTSAP